MEIQALRVSGEQKWKEVRDSLQHYSIRLYVLGKDTCFMFIVQKKKMFWERAAVEPCRAPECVNLESDFT